MKYLSKILKTTACVFVISLSIVGCSRESNTLEVQEDSQNLTSIVKDNQQERGNVPQFIGEVEYLKPDHPEYIRNSEILLLEGSEILTSEDAVKITNDDNVVYLFVNERNQYFETLYIRGQYKGALKYTQAINVDGKNQLLLSNIRGDRSIDLLSIQDIASKLPGGATSANRTYAQCVQAIVLDGFIECLQDTGSTMIAYTCGVAHAIVAPLFCAGEGIVCYFFNC